MDMDNEILERYSRQILVDEIGYDGQMALLNTEVVVQGPEPFRQWVVRYLQAAGLTVSTAAGGTLRLLVDHEEPWHIPLTPGTGPTMTSIGLQLSVFIYHIAQDRH